MAPVSEMRYSYILPNLLPFSEAWNEGEPFARRFVGHRHLRLFAQLRALLDSQFVRSGDPMSVTPRQILRNGDQSTLPGTWPRRRHRLADAGKRADLILVAHDRSQYGALGRSGDGDRAFGAAA